MPTPASHTLTIINESGGMDRAPGPWLRLLRRGVRVTAEPGRGLMDVLTRQWGLSADYIASNVQTIFLDGSPVDDVAAARPKDGSVLGLGAAMPGLVGAVMRVGSPLAGFRDDITSRTAEGADAEVTLTLKLFNTVARERGAHFLRRGVAADAAALRELVGGMDEADREGWHARLDGDPVPHEALAHALDGLDGEVAVRLG